jgi:hypothetical protein
MTQDKNVPTGEVCNSQLDLEVNEIINKGVVVEEVFEDPIFPLQVFPEIIQEIVKNAKTSLNYPEAFTASSMLFATSVAVGNTCRVKIKNGFEQSAIIYLCLAAPSGSVKSHPLEFALKPLQIADEKSFVHYQKKMAEYLSAKENLKADKDAQTETETSSKPVWIKNLISDYTLEALYSVHSHNRRSIGVYIDELAGWFKNFERYNKNSQQEFWLSAWSGKAISIDRKMTEPFLISHPFISVAGTIQTGLLAEIAKENRDKNGFIDRMLFVLLQNLKKEGWHDKEMPEELIERYHQIIQNLLVLSHLFDDNCEIQTVLLKFSVEARMELFNWVNMVNTPMVNETHDEEMKGIYTKLEIYVPRFALLLHLLDWATQNKDNPSVTIELKSVQGAIELAEYFRKTATEVNKILNNEIDIIPKYLKVWYEKLPVNFSTSESLKVGEKFNIPERSIKRILKKQELFRKVRHGKYEKIY